MEILENLPFLSQTITIKWFKRAMMTTNHIHDVMKIICFPFKHFSLIIKES